MEEAIKYKNVIREYFLEFRNRNMLLQSLFYLILFGSVLSPLALQNTGGGIWHALFVLPMILAIFAGARHTSALPPMLYLVPGTKQLREEYIRRMLIVKVMLPLALCIMVDLILLCARQLRFREVILQLVTVFFFSYCVGIVNDGAVWRNNAAKSAYGQMSYFNGPMFVVNILAGFVMTDICFSDLGNVEFWIILVIYLAIFAPLSYAIHKRWRGIRERLAVFELATKEETWDW